MYIHVCTLSIRNSKQAILPALRDIIRIMIKPINTSPLDTSNHASFECKKCGAKGVITFTNKIINVDSQSDMDYLSDMECPKCNVKLGT